jgi:S-adenosylmethionine:tRNA ribosyltransferase-isomerase
VSNIPVINPLDFRFDLPESRIPDRPLEQRDISKLLIYKEGNISQSQFKDLPAYLPTKSLLVFNNSKVIPARLLFQTNNRATIEILCLQTASKEVNITNASNQNWKCIVGNLKRWKQDDLKIETENFTLSASLVERGGEENIVNFYWNTANTFLEILEILGQIPLPPYMNRKADKSDSERYQTVYASKPGSVAAPTAGLHFTDAVLEKIKTNGHILEEVTLHVGAGTFKPIKSEKVADHKMHQEFFEVDKRLIEKMLENDSIIPVGTTSMRTLESLFHLGCNIHNGNENMIVEQWDGFNPTNMTKKESLETILAWLNKTNNDKIVAETAIMIVPGYRFRICKGIVTNFHQPESTLILLIAALLGENWRKVYDFALENDFRFLSYGDSSLLLV